LISTLILPAFFAIAGDVQLDIEEVDAKKAAIDKPAPTYPIAARQLKISGDVHVEATVAADGSVEDVRVVSGNPVLTKPAADAVKRWRFKPFEVNGKPARAIVNLSFEFGTR
jgi:protein TonB